MLLFLLLLLLFNKHFFPLLSEWQRRDLHTKNDCTNVSRSLLHLTIERGRQIAETASAAFVCVLRLRLVASAVLRPYGTRAQQQMTPSRRVALNCVQPKSAGSTKREQRAQRESGREYKRAVLWWGHVPQEFELCSQNRIRHKSFYLQRTTLETFQLCSLLCEISYWIGSLIDRTKRF